MPQGKHSLLPPFMTWFRISIRDVRKSAKRQEVAEKGVFDAAVWKLKIYTLQLSRIDRPGSACSQNEKSCYDAATGLRSRPLTEKPQHRVVWRNIRQGWLLTILLVLLTASNATINGSYRQKQNSTMMHSPEFFPNVDASHQRLF